LEDPNSLRRSDQIDSIKEINDRNPINQLTDSGNLKGPLCADVDLKDTRELFQISEPGPQTTAIDRVKTEGIRFPGIAGTCRGSDQRLVVEHDVMMIDVGQFVRIKIELTCRHARLLISAKREIAVGLVRSGLIAVGGLRI
jgi:hypothetical protein